MIPIDRNRGLALLIIKEMQNRGMLIKDILEFYYTHSVTFFKEEVIELCEEIKTQMEKTQCK